MGQTLTITFTCDVCGAAVNEASVISYKIVCAIPGTGRPSFEAGQVYGCSGAHAVQAAQNSLTALEAQRTQPV